MSLVELRLEKGDELEVRRLAIREAMSAAFAIDLVARSRDDALDLHRIVGKAASLRLEADGSEARFTGVCAEIAQTAVAAGGLATYRLRIVPALWMLTKRKNHRMFQHLSVPEIVTEILGEWHIQPRTELVDRYPKLPMRTQYGESDYDFVRRLLAEAGISFFFQTAPGEETRVVLSDAPGARQGKAEAIAFGSVLTQLRIARQVGPTRVTVSDHDFRRPQHALTATHGTGGEGARLALHEYAPGQSLAEASRGATEAMADRRGAYRHEDAHAADRARLQAEAHQAEQTTVDFTASRLDLGPGSVFSVTGHPHPVVAAGARLLVTNAVLEGDVGATAWLARGRAVLADAPYRPMLGDVPAGAPVAHDAFEPVQHTSAPRIRGVERAIVTGPAGETIHTDEHGRVTLQFPWDRESHADDRSSPWVRVSHAWAGSRQGFVCVPRVGDEVLVSYEGGHPDHPVVVGRVANATAPVPYALPEHAKRTTIQTSSDLGGNEITFDDAPGHELFYMQASRDLHKLVDHDELELTHGVRSVHVDGDLTLSASGTVTFLSAKDIVVKGGPNVLLNPPEPTKPAPKPAPLHTQPAPKHPAPKHHPAPKPAPHGGISAQGRAEMAALERAAAAYATGRPCLGWCLKKVEDYLQEVSYGKIGHGNIPRFPYAHDFADYLNQGDRYKSLGLQKLPITNPYDAPEGSIIVVRAGTPGTHNPVAGDIVVKGPGDHFYNDGEMGYGGPGNFPPGNTYVLGIYCPQ